MEFVRDYVFTGPSANLRLLYNPTFDELLNFTMKGKDTYPLRINCLPRLIAIPLRLFFVNKDYSNSNVSFDQTGWQNSWKCSTSYRSPFLERLYRKKLESLNCLL